MDTLFPAASAAHRFDFASPSPRSLPDPAHVGRAAPGAIDVAGLMDKMMERAEADFVREMLARPIQAATNPASAQPNVPAPNVTMDQPPPNIEAYFNAHRAPLDRAITAVLGPYSGSTTTSSC